MKRRIETEKSLARRALNTLAVTREPKADLNSFGMSCLARNRFSMDSLQGQESRRRLWRRLRIFTATAKIASRRRLLRNCDETGSVSAHRGCLWLANV